MALVFGRRGVSAAGKPAARIAAAILVILCPFLGIRSFPGEDKRVERAFDSMDLMLYEEAIALFGEVLREHPGRIGLRTRQAYAYFRLNRPEKAIEALTAEIEANPDDLRPLVLLSFVQYVTANEEEAETTARVYQSALAAKRKGLTRRQEDRLLRDLFPNGGIPAFVLGLRARKRLDAEVAQDFFLQAQTLSYDAAGCWLEAIRTEIDHGDLAEAQRLWEAQGDLVYARATKPKPPGETVPKNRTTFPGLKALETAFGPRDKRPPTKKPIAAIPAEAYLLEGLIHEQKGDEGAFLSCLEKAAALEPFNGKTLRTLACAHLDRGDFEEAVPLLSWAEKFNPLDFYSKILLEQAQMRRRTADRLAVTSLTEELLGKGSVHFHYVFERNPKETADQINRYALDFINRGNLAGAADVLRRFATIYEDSPTIYYNLGQFANAQGLLAEAGSCAMKAIRLKKDYRDAYDLAGNVSFKIGDFEHSFDFYDEAVRLDPGDPMAFYNLGCACKSVGNLPGAEKNWLEAVRLEKVQPAADVKAPAKPGDVSFDVKVSVEPVSAPACQNLGMLYASQGRADKALEFFEKAAAFSPNLPDPYLEIGKIYLDRKRPDKAEESFAKYLSLGGDKAKLDAARKKAAT